MTRKAYIKLMGMYMHNTNNKYGIDYLFDIEINSICFFGEMKHG